MNWPWGTGRSRSSYEAPFHGNPKDASRIRVARVDGVDPTNRTVAVSWRGRNSGPPVDVPIWSDTGSYDLPKPGELTLIVFDDAARPFAVAFRDDAYFDRRETKGFLPPNNHGEKLLYSKEFGQRLWFKDDGNLELAVSTDEGIEIQPTRRLRAKHDQLVELIVGATRFALGVVRRAMGVAPTLDQDVVISDPGGSPHREFCVDVQYQVTSDPPSTVQRAFRMIGGTGVFDDQGRPILSDGVPLRFLLEVLPTVGGGAIKLASFTVDMKGSVSITSAFQLFVQANQKVNVTAPMVELWANQIFLGMVPRDVALLGQAFLLAYSTHIHIAPQLPAGSLPTSVPLPPIPSAAVLSTTVHLQ